MNLNYFQSLFNEENTETRCRKVLDEVSPVVTQLFERFVETLGDHLGREYYIRSYDTTLTTTYHDARNPAYAEKKKNSDIGRKYTIGLYRKLNEKEHNVFMLEFNGLNQSVLIHTELNFFPFWAWVKNNKFHHVMESIPSDYSIFTGWKEKETIPKGELEAFIKSCIKPKKRPWFQIGTSFPLEGELEEGVLLQKLAEVWERLEEFRSNYIEELKISQQSFDALMLLASSRNINETELLGRAYKVDVAAVEDYKSSGKRQAFHLYDGDQMITKGFLYYLEHHDKNSPFQTIMVQLEGHNHIFTSAREILGTGKKEWWITKVFSTQNLNNHEVMLYAMKLLDEHGYQVRNTEYLIGTFDNDTRSFVEGADNVKKTFIDAALIFAHASKRLELPEGSINPVDPGPVDSIEPNFVFDEIHQVISDSSFTFSMETIRDLHLNLTSLDDKHFVLLTGISGTGKTQLCRLYANAVYGLEYENDNPYFTIIPVRPDWTDASALFGYYSTFEKRYIKTEFLNVLLNALKEREKPHFILLDEMNLARVEYYLSDYLSAVESRKEIQIHQDDTISDIPQKLIIPPNVYLLGTLNVDETTHSISDKVLDRAFVMTLSDVDFATYWEQAEQELKETLETEFRMLNELHQVLIKFDLHFGYRTMGEILQKLYANSQLPEEYQMDSLEALDRAISEKVLTKVRGDERISEMLQNIEMWLTENIKFQGVSLKHVKRMQEELDYYGATQFWR
ncbi:McrB family protein [Oceanobacillus saliphilus]|uniref:McrB family protein n=1 Tax=Oceanobacillus saliphilus TaxID=2925834 RepID=UPI00201D513C|nr:AAA family ATPase [Oceanobacillus saliphilus]